MDIDLSAIGALRDRVSSLDERAMSGLTEVLAASALTEVANGFRHSRDPYGNAWAPLKYREGQPLLKTGRMRASVHPVRNDANGFTIEIGASYAKFHQAGAQGNRTRAARAVGPTRVASVARSGKASRLSGARRTAAGGVIGLPRRQMLPEESTGGLGPIWSRTFERDTARFLERRLRSGH